MISIVRNGDGPLTATDYGCRAARCNCSLVSEAEQSRGLAKLQPCHLNRLYLENVNVYKQLRRERERGESNKRDEKGKSGKRERVQV